MTSWRQNNPSNDWMTWVDLIDPRTGEPREVNVTIESVAIKGVEVTGLGGVKSRKNALQYKGWPKPHAFGATIGDTIQSITGTDQLERWPGTRLTLFVTTTRAKSGKTVNCIRVKPMAPKSTARQDAPSNEPPPAAAVEQQRHEQQQHSAPIDPQTKSAATREPGQDG